MVLSRQPAHKVQATWLLVGIMVSHICKAGQPLIRVYPRPGNRSRGLLMGPGFALPCALGRGGVSRMKREGDGATPAGLLRVLGGFVRTDRRAKPASRLKLQPIRPDDGWCDDPRDPRYNQKVRLPFRAGHERLWRDDEMYDVILDLDWNRRPAVKGRGSAIFLHIARQGLTPTQGCIAVSPAGMRLLLRYFRRDSLLRVF